MGAAGAGWGSAPEPAVPAVGLGGEAGCRVAGGAAGLAPACAGAVAGAGLAAACAANVAGASVCVTRPSAARSAAQRKLRAARIMTNVPFVIGWVLPLLP